MCDRENALKAVRIQKLKTKNIKKIADSIERGHCLVITGHIESAKSFVESLINKGWLRELKTRYIATEKSFSTIEKMDKKQEEDRLNELVWRVSGLENLGTKDIDKIAQYYRFSGRWNKPTPEAIRSAKKVIKNLLKDGWLKELPDRYVMTEKARERVKMLEDRVKKKIMT